MHSRLIVGDLGACPPGKILKIGAVKFRDGTIQGIGVLIDASL